MAMWKIGLADHGLRAATDFTGHDFLEMVRYDHRGLVAVVVQDAQNLAVLTLAHANREALECTLRSGYSHFFSRSRQQLWKKGERSGHMQRVCEVWLDCDGDAVLYKVIPSGPACQTGRSSCFHNPVLSD
jgi:phosphoribosyl-AMP cyclohydrolase / phosphoribosyl-ATP pyrophosphohydrolase